MSREKQQFLSDLATDLCPSCEGSDFDCINSRRLKKCLRSCRLTGNLDNVIFTIRKQYRESDFRRWDFERTLSREQLAEVLRGNA